jgi:hypothetical protein
MHVERSAFPTRVLKFVLYGPAKWAWMQAYQWAWFGGLFAVAFGVASINEFGVAAALFVLSGISALSHMWMWEEAGIPPALFTLLKIGGSFVLFVLVLAALGILNVYRDGKPWSQLPKAIENARNWIHPQEQELPTFAPAPLVTLSGYVASQAPYAEGIKFAGLIWHPNEVDVRADITTGSTDIQNLDFTIQMDTEIVGIGQATKIPGCTMFPAGNVAAIGATILDSRTGKPVAIPLSRDMAWAPTYRVQCQNVFANTIISFSIASVFVNPGPPKAGEKLPGPWQPPKFLVIKGTYKTRDGDLITSHPLEYSTAFRP